VSAADFRQAAVHTAAGKRSCCRIEVMQCHIPVRESERVIWTGSKRAVKGAADWADGFPEKTADRKGRVSEDRTDKEAGYQRTAR